MHAGSLWLKARPALRGLTWAQWLLAFMLVAGVFNFPGRVRGFVEPAWAVVRQWADPETQLRMQLGDVPYAVLRETDALLPRDASILLVTDGHDVRHFEYTTFHRALYFLTPRAVWWVSPAPSDGTWESNWWISALLGDGVIRDIVNEKQVTHALLMGEAQALKLGERMAEWPGASLVTLDEGITLSPLEVRHAEFAGPAWPLQMAMALGVIVALGYSTLALIGYRAAGYEGLALAWLFGAGITSLGMTYLGWLGVGLDGQRVLLTAAALVGMVSTNRQRINESTNRRISESTNQRINESANQRIDESANQRDNESTQQRIKVGEGTTDPTGALRRVVTTKGLLPGLVLGVYVAFVVILAVGRPLTIWDSWVTWGMKARTLFIEGGWSKVMYVDPSRAVTHLDYPLMIPQLEAWSYDWLGAADDRFAGWQSIAFYLALLGVGSAVLRRRGASASSVLWVSVALAALGPLALWSGLVFAEVQVAALALTALVYLIDWLERGSQRALWIAVLAAGLLPWAKREGWVLLFALCICVMAFVRERRAWKAVGAIMLGAVLIAAPWYLVVSANGIANTDFLPINFSTFTSHLDRLPVIMSVMVSNLLDASWNLVWPMAVLFGVLLIWRRVRTERLQQSPTNPTGALRRVVTTKHKATAKWLLPAVAVLYLVLMAMSFVFSAYMPYQQHIASSALRLMTHVAPLVLLWMAYHSVETA